jgi:hypothetical protein
MKDSSLEEEKTAMSNNHCSSDAPEIQPRSPFFHSKFQVAEEPLCPIPMGLRIFQLLGRSSAFLACSIFAVVFLTSSPARLAAQTAGEVSGHVSDTTGASIPDANVTLTNVATGSERPTDTTSAGDYTFTEVPVGVYRITATHSGFKTGSRPVEDQDSGTLTLDN